MGALLDIELEPVWKSAREAREQSHQILSGAGFNSQVTQMLSMVACELTENAIKYASNSEPASIRLSLQQDASHLDVQVSSPMGSDARLHYDRLQKTLAWLAGFEDPMDAYVARMQEIALAEDDGSGLGLARIAFEGESHLSCELDPEQTLHVRARYELEQ